MADVWHNPSVLRFLTVNDATRWLHILFQTQHCSSSYFFYFENKVSINLRILPSWLCYSVSRLSNLGVCRMRLAPWKPCHLEYDDKSIIRDPPIGLACSGFHSCIVVWTMWAMRHDKYIRKSSLKTRYNLGRQASNHINQGLLAVYHTASIFPRGLNRTWFSD